MIAADGTAVIEEVTTVASRIRQHPRDWSGVAVALGFGLLIGALLIAATKN